MRLALRNRHTSPLLADTLADRAKTSMDYERSLEWSVGKAEVRKMLESLTEDQWETVRLYFFEGYTLKEIADFRKQSPGNVRNHFYRGLEKLRNSTFSTGQNGRISGGTKMCGPPVKAL